MSIELAIMDNQSIDAMLSDQDLKPYHRGWYWAIIWEGLVMLPLDGPYPGPATAQLFAKFYTETAAQMVRCKVTKQLCRRSRCDLHWCERDEHYP